MPIYTEIDKTGRFSDVRTCISQGFCTACPELLTFGKHIFGSVAPPAGFPLRSVEVHYFRHPAKLLHQVVNGKFHLTMGSFSLQYRAQ